jgi:hypothetical protein
MKYKKILVTRQYYVKHYKSFSNSSAYLNEHHQTNAVSRIAKQAEMNTQGCLVKIN